MNKIYTKKYLFDLLFLLQNEVSDLTSWSVFNKGILRKDIQALREQSDSIRKQFIELDKQGRLEGGEN